MLPMEDHIALAQGELQYLQEQEAIAADELHREETHLLLTLIATFAAVCAQSLNDASILTTAVWILTAKVGMDLVCTITTTYRHILALRAVRKQRKMINDIHESIRKSQQN